MKPQFDMTAFYSALDSLRGSKGLTWKEIAHATGISASTLTRMAQGRRPDVDGLAALLKWSGFRAEDFIPGHTQREAEPISQIAAILRADPELTDAGRRTIETVLRATYGGLKRSKP
jgi:transcriptional regulator with XRE-family HTH domain